MFKLETKTLIENRKTNLIIYIRDFDKVRTRVKYVLNLENEWDQKMFEKTIAWYITKRMKLKHDFNMINANITQLFF